MIIPYNPKMKIIKNMIHTLYELPDCSCGGCCHIVTDDENIRDSDLHSVINYCKDNSNKIDTELSSWICQLMLQLTIEQRALLFVSMNNEIDIEFYSSYEFLWNNMIEEYKEEVKNLIDGQCKE